MIRKLFPYCLVACILALFLPGCVPLTHEGANNPNNESQGITGHYLVDFGLECNGNLVWGTIESNNNINVTVPNGTDVSSLKAVFDYDGVTVSVNNQRQYSGSSAQNFSSNVIYTVYSTNGNTSSYTVHVVIAPPQLGFSTQVFGIAQTIYSVHGGSSDPYAQAALTPTFLFTNNSGNAINIGNVTIDTAQTITWSKTGDSCSNRSIASGESCSISGSFSMANPESAGNISIVLAESMGSRSYIYNLNVYSIAYEANYAAIRIIRQHNINHAAYIEISDPGIESNNVQLLNYANGHIPTLVPLIGTTYQAYAKEIPAGSTGYTFYFPNTFSGTGGNMYVSYDSPTQSPESSAPTIPPDASNMNTPMAMFELNYPKPSVLYMDISNIQMISIPGQASGVDELNNLYTIAGTYPQWESVSAVTIMSKIQSALTSNWPNMWGLPQSFQTFTSGTHQGQLVRVLGPSSIWTGGYGVLPNGFNNESYQQFNDDVWAYYESAGHNLRLDATEIANCVAPTSEANPCILSGHVESTDHLMHFAPEDASRCPTSSAAMYCGNANTESNTFTMSEFTVWDWMQGASNESDTTYGPTFSYRSMGKYIVAAQNAGFLPFCDRSNIVYGKVAIESFGESEYFVPHYGCLQNYNAYTDTVINQYDKQNHIYFPYYGYTYDDVLHLDSTVTVNPESFPMTVILGKFYNQ